MSVYTHLSDQQVADFLELFDLGTYQSHTGISAGVENTNYFVVATRDEVDSEYVLTVFEHHDQQQVQNFIAIGRHLAGASIPVPGPVSDKQGEYLHLLEGKPAILCPRLPGGHAEVLAADHCRQIGAALAKFHLAGKDFDQAPKNDRGLLWWADAALKILPTMDDEEQQDMLFDEVEYQQSFYDLWQNLPRGLIHGDLFHDNALFSAGNEGQGQGEQLGAILDIYNACEEAWVYDLAIVANDWCSETNGNWQTEKLGALFEGYQSIRPLTEEEQFAWGICVRGAALRFWLSRLMTQKHQQAAKAEDDNLIATEKDPMEYFLKLLARREQFPDQDE